MRPFHQTIFIVDWWVHAKHFLVAAEGPYSGFRGQGNCILFIFIAINIT